MSLLQIHFRLKHRGKQQRKILNKSLYFFVVYETNFVKLLFFSYVRCIISWNKNTLPPIQNMLLLMGSLLPSSVWDLPSFLNHLGTFRPSLMTASEYASQWWMGHKAAGVWCPNPATASDSLRLKVPPLLCGHWFCWSQEGQRQAKRWWFSCSYALVHAVFMLLILQLYRASVQLLDVPLVLLIFLEHWEGFLWKHSALSSASPLHIYRTEC